MRARVEKATNVWVTALCLEMRDSDKLEVYSLFPQHSLYEVLEHSIWVGQEVEVATCNGELLGIFGIDSAAEDKAIPWLLGCNALDRYPLAAGRVVRERLIEWRKRYRMLFNWVHAKNVVSIRWLEELDFVMCDEEPRGPLGELFRKFEWRGNV